MIRYRFAVEIETDRPFETAEEGRKIAETIETAIESSEFADTIVSRGVADLEIIRVVALQPEEIK